ncbi:MAG: hypothetical protein KA116_11470 [Proteobacteria bacterium]|nr:hypothetical protein [Pseudomonadota bacterium]
MLGSSGYRYFLLSSFFILASGLWANGKSDQSRLFNFQAEEQEESNWCWAAAVNMARKHFRLPEKEQCKIVSEALGRDCCGFWTSSSEACDIPGYSDRVARNYGMNVRVIEANSESIPRAIKQGYFPILKLNYIGKSSGHLVVAYGTYRENNNLYLEGYDPNYGYFVISANNFIVRGNKFGGFWSQSFLVSAGRAKGFIFPEAQNPLDSFSALELKDWDLKPHKPDGHSFLVR